MAKKTVNSDIYNLSQLVDDVKSTFIPNETSETLAIGTYGYIGALESNRLQTQVQMTGELCNEVFPSRARLERNVITHAIMANIEDINAYPAKMTAFLAIKESDIEKYFGTTTNIFYIDRECPFYIGDYEFHLEYSIKLQKILINNKKAGANAKDNYAYTARYDIPSGREVPTSTITSEYLSPPAVVFVNDGSETGEYFIYLTVVLSQVEHYSVSKKLVTSNIIDNKTINFEFDDQLAYFEIHCSESDNDYYVTPVFEGSSVPEGNESKYYCWYQYIDTNLIRVRFDRKSYMPGLNANVECLVKTCKGASGNFTFAEDTYITLEYTNDTGEEDYISYNNVTCLVTPVSDSEGGKDRKSKKELQSLIPKETLSRGSLTTITDLNNYFGMIDSDYGRIIIQKKIDNQIERVYYAYLVAKDTNENIIPSNTVDIKVGLEDLIKSQLYTTEPARYLLPSGTCFRLGDDGIAYVNNMPLLESGWTFTPKSITRGNIVESNFYVEVTDDTYDAVSCAVSVGGDSTNTNLFPAEGDDRYSYIKSSDLTVVEDYIQMGTGKNYDYTINYTTLEDNSIITVRDKYLNCLDLQYAYYTVNGVTRTFDSLPITASELPAGSKVTFGIVRKLNAKASGIVYFKYNGNTYKLNNKSEGTLSTILNILGFEGAVTNAESLSPDIIQLTENGVIENETLLSTSSVNTTSSNSSTSNEDNPYKLTTVREADLPAIEDREENEWFYVINKTVDQSTYDETETNVTHTSGDAEDYTLNVAKASEMPPIEERQENNYWYSITGSSVRKEIPDDPEEPEDPGELTGKEYKVSVLQNFQDTTVKLKVTIDGTEYEISCTQDRHNIENGVYVTEAGVDTASVSYLTYVPTLDQSTWPEELTVGQQVKYTLRYKSTSNTYEPEVEIKLSRGLDYVTFSNKITYPDGSIIQYEPAEVSLENERGFIYTNPYAVNINSYRLYAAFYMMSMNENPYLHFDNIYDKSNVQFISTNAYWNRPFSGVNKNIYTLTCTLTQSVQADLGISSTSTDPEAEDYFTPLVKLYAVFYRNGSAYRYRSMNLTSYDPLTYSYTFTQDFNSLDIFDNDNNIKVSNVQVSGQSEYTVSVGKEGVEATYTINNGGVVLLSSILTTLGITLTDITSVVSDDRSCLDAVPIYNKSDITDFYIKSFIDFDGELNLTITCKDESTTVLTASCTRPAVDEYGFFTPNTELKLFALCGIPDIEGKYNKDKFNAICPGLDNWTLTNVYDVVNGVTFYHNYSEIMGSRCTPYGEDSTGTTTTVMDLEGYYVKGIPMLGYDYCQDETLVQSAIDALNYRKAYLDSSTTLLENSFGLDFKLFNTYGPSKTYYIRRDIDVNGILDDTTEYIDKVNLTFNFRVKLVAEKDSYTKDNIIEEIKSYIEDLDDLGELHIPNLITQITTNYREQISYFEYLGFNDYGPEIQHIYKDEDDETDIHTAPEFLNINNTLNNDGTVTPCINIYVSEI